MQANSNLVAVRRRQKLTFEFICIYNLSCQEISFATASKDSEESSFRPPLGVFGVLGGCFTILMQHGPPKRKRGRIFMRPPQ